MTIDVQNLEAAAVQVQPHSVAPTRRPEASADSAQQDSAHLTIGASALSDAVLRMAGKQLGNWGASTERLASLHHAVKTGSLPIDVRNLAEAIMREESLTK